MKPAESRFFHGKDRIPDRRLVADLLPSSFRSASVGYAVLRKFVERKKRVVWLVARGPLIDTITILLGITVGASTQATQFLTLNSIKIFGLGALSFVIATCAGILFVKFFNLFLKEGNKINPLIGNSGVSAVPDSARISQNVGLEYDPTNYLLMHAMGPNVAGVIGSAVAAGILLGFLG